MYIIGFDSAWTFGIDCRVDFVQIIAALVSLPIVSQYLSYDAAYGLDMFILVLFGKPATFRVTN